MNRKNTVFEKLSEAEYEDFVYGYMCWKEEFETELTEEDVERMAEESQKIPVAEIDMEQTNENVKNIKKELGLL